MFVFINPFVYLYHKQYGWVKGYLRMLIEVMQSRNGEKARRAMQNDRLERIVYRYEILSQNIIILLLF